VWLALSPGRRRLRFSFQFNDVKDPTGFRPPHCFAPVVGGGGYLLTGLGGVNRSFRTFCDNPVARNLTAKIAAGRRGASLQVRDDSIEAREHTHFKTKIKRLMGRQGRRLAMCSGPKREAAI
jgi:hypothetical protein